MSTMECMTCQLRKLDEEAAEEQDEKASERQRGIVGMMGFTTVIAFFVGTKLGILLSLPIGAVLGWLLVFRKQQMEQEKATRERNKT